SVSYLPPFGRERNLFSDDFLACARQSSSPTAPFQSYFESEKAGDELSRLMYLDTMSYLPGDILTKVDRMSMANSLEVRCPLLDHVFVEWAVSLPSRFKLNFHTQKYMLRKLAEKLGIPGSVLNRPKTGFAMPLAHWWRKELKDDLLQILLEPRTLQRGYFRPHAVRQLVAEHLSGRRSRPTDIWLLLVLELWHRNFLEARRRPATLPFNCPAIWQSSYAHVVK